MPNIDKVRIPSAITRRTKLDLGCDHVTTLDFGVAQPVYYRHMMKDESIDINALATVRPFPITVPTFGRMRLNMRAFFIPYSQVFPLWDSFYTDTIGNSKDSSALVSNPPLIANSTFIEFFVGNGATSGMFAYSVTSGAFDFVYSVTNYRFTNLGRWIVKVFRSLGYRWTWDDKDLTKYNALGILAWAKMFIDWYSNQNYLNDATLLKVKRLFEYREPLTPLELTIVDLLNIVAVSSTVCYDNDAYFNAAWDNPMSPTSGVFSQFTANDVSLQNTGYADNVRVVTYSNGTPVMQQLNNTVVNIGSQYIHDVLKALTDYQKRHQLGSALPVSRWLAQWGASVPSQANSRSIYIGGKSIDINVGEVMSTASTGLADVGDYSGRSFGQGDGKWSFHSEEFGVLIICSSILPLGSLYQGVDRNNLSITKEEFFNPEFDGMSVQAITRREVLTPNFTSVSSGQADAVFGFTGRYGHLKRPLNFVTGDLDCPSVMRGGSSWHLMRILEAPEQIDFNYAGLAHGEQFARLSDHNNYNRIFNSDEVNLDRFFGNFHFEIASYAPCRPLFDTYEFEDNGTDVTLDNGAFVN